MTGLFFGIVFVFGMVLRAQSARRMPGSRPSRGEIVLLGGAVIAMVASVIVAVQSHTLSVGPAVLLAPICLLAGIVGPELGGLTALFLRQAGEAAAREGGRQVGGLIGRAMPWVIGLAAVVITAKLAPQLLASVCSFAILALGFRALFRGLRPQPQPRRRAVRR